MPAAHDREYHPTSDAVHVWKATVWKEEREGNGEGERKGRRKEGGREGQRGEKENLI